MADRLEERLSELVRRAPAGAKTAVAAWDSRAGREIGIEASAPFPSASIIKLLILVELFAAIDGGRLDGDESLEAGAAELVGGSGVLHLLRPGHRFSLLELAALMITVSDNSASNLLIDRLGLPAINRRAEMLGLEATCLQRKFFDLDARAAGRDNFISGRDVTSLLKRLALRGCVSPEADTRMIEILKRQQFTERIARVLPPSWCSASKSGALHDVAHDACIVDPDGEPLVICVLTAGWERLEDAETMIRDIAREIVREWRP